MKKEFTTYEQSLALKELGFDEPCFACVDEDGVYLKGDIRFNSTIQSYEPLYQQAFRWFREKYHIFHNIDKLFADEFGYTIYENDKEPMNYFNFNTYEEAESACLDKLIEICKKK